MLVFSSSSSHISSRRQKLHFLHAVLQHQNIMLCSLYDGLLLFFYSLSPLLKLPLATLIPCLIANNLLNASVHSPCHRFPYIRSLERIILPIHCRPCTHMSSSLQPTACIASCLQFYKRIR